MQAWLTRIQKHGPRWVWELSPRLVSGLLAALIVVEAARILLPLLPSPAYASMPAPRPPARLSLGVDAQSIVERHLFGVAPDDSVSGSDSPSPTSENLLLQGTIAASDPHQGVAIITADGPAEVYKPGDKVGGVTLDSIYLDRVLLNRGGRLEILALPRLIAARGDTPTPLPVAAAEDTPTPRRGTPKTMGELVHAEAATREDSGALQGFRLRPGRNGSAFMRSGLRPGDIMTAIDGTPLADEDQHRSQDVVNSMLNADHAVVTVLRNGRPVEVTVQLGR